jgi:hypothetical protein
MPMDNVAKFPPRGEDADEKDGFLPGKQLLEKV